MMKRLWFQLHWFFGITAGLVLAVVGLTGALLSYDDELTRAFSSGVMTVPVRDSGRLPLPELVARVHEAVPDRRILLMTEVRTPEDAVGVRLSTGDGPRGETYFVDPYTGEMLGRSKADVVFRFIMDIHRFLTVEGIGKQITGAATLLLFLLALSGLYLRWPRRLGNWRAWFHIDFKKKGRPFLWNLHAVIGTVVLVPYLLSATTGLYWSYDWWRGMLFSIAGVQQPVRNKPAPAPKMAKGEGGQKRGGAEGGERKKPALPNLADTDVSVAWDAFKAEVPNYTKVYLRPAQKPGGPLQMTWLDDTVPHERAFSRLDVDAATGKVSNVERYGQKTLGGQLMTSIYALHRGSFFGPVGIVVMMLSSLMMPVFFVTGWMLYLDRRKKKRALAASRPAVAANGTTGANGANGKPGKSPAAGSLADEGVLIGFASQSGVAEGLAWQTAGMLQGAGVPAQIQPLARIGEAQLGTAKRALFIVSTFGDGEPPDSARRFAQQLMNQAMALPTLRFAVLSLGDSHYDTFCGFGRKLDGWLRAQGGVAAFEPIEVDRGDPGAWARWQERLGEWLGRPLATVKPDGAGNAPVFQSWQLEERVLLNPGSTGLPAYHVAFTPPAGAKWVAGDLVEVLPRHTQAHIDAWLAGSVWASDVRVTVAGREATLGEALRERVLPEAAPPAGVDLQAWLEPLATLPEREYSIASTPAEGKLALLVRQTRNPDGTLGLGSGWLTDGVALGEDVTMRVRPNPGFHGPQDDRGMILIGNGTGLAGLRAHLSERVAQGHRRNWLIFGERQAAHDAFHDTTLREWQAQGGIARLDRVYSRDQAARIYVQDRVREAAADIAEWVQQGASIYVCGSLAGMAPAVDAALAEAIGADTLLDLSAHGRYRRDIY
ncbi:Sulfite reductase [NADPH] flavoprotein alpha-component [Pandoraea pneumonica]|uniref:Sulfite reductase [NADPH] flavoprotein alpha-component n=1 Tax=Pandoraea pneumonica TaxID=2508299 RepID=A0A5E4RWN8_9BURK|nr:PepSY domain-containing protein [Pandoraea pneumonica]VVD66832.1 Sulfite reductase [NADPH] flavoprotein alpha-component [Pandoraea pneumonica]